jgi:hypothetical protein
VHRFVAGCARVPLLLRPGVELMGYALREGRASGVLDPLYARAVYLRGARETLLVILDLCLLAPAQAADVRGRLSARTGIPGDRILVSCIHTHSGPDTGLGALLAGREAPEHVPEILAAAVEAGMRAMAAAVPARLGVGMASLAVGRNRRREDAAVDRAARIVRIDHADGAPLAILWLHGCHPTALGHENLAYSADWPGAASATVEAAFPGALAAFVLSAHADVDPRTRGLQDLARTNRSLGVDAETMRGLGREAGAAVARAAGAIVTMPDVPVDVASMRVPLPVHGGADAAAAEERLALRRREAFEALGLASDARVRLPELYRLADACVATLAPAEARERVARVRLYLRDRSAPAFAGGRVPEVEVQALRVGDARWLALPLEPTVRVGLEWTRRTGSASAAVLSIANGWLRYLPHPDEFAEPHADQGYEVLTSTFVPEAASRLLDAGEQLLSSLSG